MDTTAAQLTIVIAARDEASAKIKQLQGTLENVKKGANIVSGGMAIMGAAVVAASAYSVKLASDFQSSMTLIQTQAGASSDEVQKMSNAVLDLSGKVGFAPKELADALFYVESAGYRGSQALSVLTASAQGAKVGNANLASTTNTLTSVVSSGVKGAKDFSEAMGAVNAIVGAGKMHMEDLTAALGTGILATAKTSGISIQQLGAAMDTLVNSGMPAIDASTRLRMTLSLLIAPSSQATKELEKIGLSQKKLFNDMQTGGIQKVLEDFNRGLNGVGGATETVISKSKLTVAQIETLKNNITNTQSQLKIYSEQHVKAGVATEKHNLAITKAQERLAGYQAKLAGTVGHLQSVGVSTMDAADKAQLLGKIFGSREGSTFETLLQNADKFDNNLKQITNTGNNFKSAWQKTSEDANLAFARLGAQVQVLAIHYGNILLPAVTKFVNFLANNLIPFIENTTKFFERHKLAVVALAGIVGGILTMSIIAFTIAMAPAIIAVGAFIIAFLPFILLGAAIVAAVALVIVYWKQLQVIGQVVFTSLGNFFSNLGKTVSGVMNQIIQDVKNMVNSVIDHINGLIHGINNVGGKIGLGAIKIPDIPKFEQGGYVPNTGLAIVHQGEFVMSKAMLEGRQSIPSNISNTTNNNTPVNIYATINQEMDLAMLGNKLAFAIRNSR